MYCLLQLTTFILTKLYLDILDKVFGPHFWTIYFLVEYLTVSAIFQMHFYPVLCKHFTIHERTARIWLPRPSLRSDRRILDPNLFDYNLREPVSHRTSDIRNRRSPVLCNPRTSGLKLIFKLRSFLELLFKSQSLLWSRSHRVLKFCDRFQIKFMNISKSLIKCCYPTSNKTAKVLSKTLYIIRV